MCQDRVKMGGKLMHVSVCARMHICWPGNVYPAAFDISTSLVILSLFGLSKFDSPGSTAAQAPFQRPGEDQPSASNPATFLPPTQVFKPLKTPPPPGWGRCWTVPCQRPGLRPRRAAGPAGGAAAAAQPHPAARHRRRGRGRHRAAAPAVRGAGRPPDCP